MRKDTKLHIEAYHAGYQAGYENGKRDAVRHGHWIEVWHREDEFVNHHFLVCSCCGTEFHASLMAGCCADIEGDGYVFPNCPACRAVMDGKESGDE